jgi:NAD(P)-dependent dehydrogenase (short-subunit alcohol dehydrogenase family)
MQLKPINQQVVAVVGASSGIGRETALQFARQGAKVVVSARSQAGLESLVEEIRQAGGDAISVVADVTDFAQVQAIADQAVAQYGRLDTWVHLAAVELYATFEQTTPEEFKRLIDVNLMGQVHGAKVALSHLKREGGGALIHITSVEAVRSLPLQSAYAASKHAVSGFLEAMRVELMHEKLPISVTEVRPASINTPFFDKARTKLGVKPMGAPPLYPPSDVAKVILYAAEHPTRDIVVGDAGKAIALMQRVSPALVDAYMVSNGFDAQHTDQPKSADAPDNLYEPIAGFNRAEGDLGDQTQPSLTTWLDTNPAVKWGALAITALGVAALLGAWGNEI